MSVLIINELLSTWKGFTGFSYEIPLAFTCCRIGKDHKPRARNETMGRIVEQEDSSDS